MRNSNIGVLALIGLVACMVIVWSIDTHSTGSDATGKSTASDILADMVGLGSSADVGTRSDNGIGPTGNRLSVQHRNPLYHLKRVKFDETIARPLFASTRRPFIPATRSAPIARKLAPARSRRASYKLLGVLMGDKNSVAVIRDLLKGENIRVSEGDEVHGWRISQVERHRISLKKRGAKVMVLKLFPE